MSTVTHFEIHVDDADRAVKFYQDVFEWKIEKWDGPVDYWMIAAHEEGQPGIDGAITLRSNMPGNTTNTINVTDVDEYVAKIESSGGKVIAPKMTIPGIGYMAYCQDPDDNVFGIMQMDPSAE